MTDRTSLQKSNSHAVFLIVISILVLIAALGITLWKSSQSPGKAPEFEDAPLELRGIVTRKETSCGVRTLQEDGTIKIGPGICDSGESIVVGGKSIATSSGGPGVNGFNIDIDSINPGDEVTVRYILNEYGGLTLDCQSCSVIRTKHVDRAESF